jgi:hypothetical protein
MSLDSGLETSDIPPEQESEGPVHWDQQLISPTQRGRCVETTPYDPSKEPIPSAEAFLREYRVIYPANLARTPLDFDRSTIA